MAADRDPKGYYEALGLASNASQAQIVHAYREWAKRYHPDANRDGDAADFIRIKEAYDTLSDPLRRRKYNSDEKENNAAHRPPTETRQGSADKGGESKHQPVDAIRCSACGAITAQPRQCEFHRVVSFVFYVRRDIWRGVFCATCARKKSLKESAICWLFGWWSIVGIFWTPLALWRNLCLGEKPKLSNTHLLLTQGLYFSEQGEFELAHACLDQARIFAEYKTLELLAEIRKSLPVAAQRPLRNQWSWLTSTTAMHVAPIIIAISCVLYLSYPSLVDWYTATHVTSSNPTNRAPLIVHPSESKPADKRYVADPTVTTWMQQGNAYVNGGSLRRFSTVMVLRPSPDPKFVIAKTQDGRIVTIEALALATGDGAQAKFAWCTGAGELPPLNNEVLGRSRSGRNKIEISNLGNYDAVAKFRNTGNTVVLTIFVSSYSIATIDNFPDGNFRLEYAIGHNWSRRCAMFMESMHASRFPIFNEFTSFDVSAGRYKFTEYDYTITPVANGNVRAETLDLEAFGSDEH